MKIIYSYSQAAELLNQGHVGVVLTDTVYGLAAKCSNISATTKLYRLKNREKKPGTVIAANIQQLIDLGLPKHELQIAEQFWPGPVSIVINIGNNLEYLHQAVGSVAFRVVADPKILKLLEITGPLITSSANTPGMPTSNNITEAINYFSDTVDFYLDCGEAINKPPSTVIKIVNNEIKILRQGASKIDLEKF